MATKEVKRPPAKPAAETREIVKRDSDALVKLSYLSPEAGRPRGGEELGPRDVVQPRLAICQSMTPHRKEKSDKYIKGLQEGDYFNTAYGKRYGRSVLVVPIFFFKSQIRFKDYEDGGGILCQAQDGKRGIGDPGGECVRCQFGPILGWSGDGDERHPPECTEFKNYAVIIIPRDKMPSAEDAAILSFKTTSLKKSNEWASRLRSYGRDWWTTIHELTTVEVSNDRDQSWFIPVASVYDGPRVPAGLPEGMKVPPALEQFANALVGPEMYRIGKDVYEGMVAMRKAGTLKIDLDPADSPAGSEDRATEFLPREPGDDNLEN